MQINSLKFIIIFCPLSISCKMFLFLLTWYLLWKCITYITIHINLTMSFMYTKHNNYR